MDDPVFVRRLHRLGDLLRHPNRFLHRHRPTPHPLAHRLAVDQLHHQEALTVHLLEAVDAGDIGVRKRREHSRLPFKARQPLRVLGEQLRQDLESHVATEVGVLSLPYFTHTSFAELGRHSEMRKTAADHVNLPCTNLHRYSTG